jgi:hypothetical protein
MMTRERVAALRALLEKAHARPWRRSRDRPDDVVIENDGDWIANVGDANDEARAQADADLIAEAVNALPELIEIAESRKLSASKKLTPAQSRLLAACCESDRYVLAGGEYIAARRLARLGMIAYDGRSGLGAQIVRATESGRAHDGTATERKS